MSAACAGVDDDDDDCDKIRKVKGQIRVIMRAAC